MCKDCNHKWEQEQSIKEEAIKVCPNCKKESAQRLISCGGAFILQGGGWAKEGYK